ncbi:MAG: hypothetical protein FJ284_03510 [Planctomycetes bacterium]|nr:hypothetical protein [Planctomycetota bacterium]
MNHVAATKSVSSAALAVTSAQTASLEIDTLGFEYASIDVIFSPFTAAVNPTTAATVLRIAHSDSTGTAAQTNVTGFVGGTDFTVSAGSTATSALGYSHRFDVDLRGKRRYVTVYATPASTCGVVTTARLGKAEAGPADASAKGVSTQAVG